MLAFGRLVRDSVDRLGLVGRGDRDRIHTRHLQESIAPALLEALNEGTRVLDVGSGGGFPAIPIAVLRKDLTLTLTEPRTKKAAFLERVAVELGLETVTVMTGPVEDLPRIHAGERWDVALSRAVRWNRGMIRALRRVLVEDAPVVRFGSPEPQATGVSVIPIHAERAIQIWPPPTWRHLPGAS